MWVRGMPVNTHQHVTKVLIASANTYTPNTRQCSDNPYTRQLMPNISMAPLLAYVDILVFCYC